MKRETQSDILPSWPPSCDRCREKLTGPGALIFSSPSQDNLVWKQHLCVACYDDLREWMVRGNGEQE